MKVVLCHPLKRVMSSGITDNLFLIMHAVVHYSSRGLSEYEIERMKRIKENNLVMNLIFGQSASCV